MKHWLDETVFMTRHLFYFINFNLLFIFTGTIKSN